MVLIRKAIANKWNVPAETRVRVIDGMFTAMEVGNVRTTLAVGRTALAMTAANFRNEQALRERARPTD